MNIWIGIVVVIVLIGGGWWYLNQSSVPATSETMQLQQATQQNTTNSSQPVTQQASQNSNPRTAIMIDASSLVTSSAQPTFTGTASGPQTITLEIHTPGKSALSLGQIIDIPVTNGHWSIALGGKSKWGSGFINDLSPGKYIVCAAAPNYLEDCEQLTVSQ